MTATMIKECQSTKEIKSRQLINDIIQDYHNDKFRSMKKYINFYGSEIFFTDLWSFMNEQTYRDILNKYLLFVGITLQYHKNYLSQADSSQSDDEV
jgi:hypothetical protein